MSFWKTSDGEDIHGQATGYDGGGGEFEPIPANTEVLMTATEAKWDEVKGGAGEQFIALTWEIIEPVAYKGRKVFQKLWVLGNDPNSKDPVKKADNAKRFLAAIDAIAGGKLAGLSEEPSDTSLQQAICGKPMMGKIQQWKMDVHDATTDTMIKKVGNFVGAVSPRHRGGATPAQGSAQTGMTGRPATGGARGGSTQPSGPRGGGNAGKPHNDEIPF